MAKKQLQRSKRYRKIAGVCAGIGQYLDVDPTVIRLVWVLATLLTGLGPGIIAYVIAWIIMPETQ